MKQIFINKLEEIHIMFDNKKEFAKAMIEGRKFVTPKNTICFYDENFIDSPYRTKLVSHNNLSSTSMQDSWNYYKEVTEQHWFTKPCICWVSDNSIEDCAGELTLVIEYTEENDFPYKTSSTRYKYAVPATKEEVLAYIN